MVWTLGAGSSGLVGYWPVDEASTPSADFSGQNSDADWNGNVAQNTTDVAPVSFSNPGALDFDNADDYLQVDTPTIPTGDFTYAAWIYPATTNDEMIYMYSDGSGNNEFFVRVFNGNIEAFLDNAQRVISSGAPISTNTWYHVALTRSGSSLTIYIDGFVNGTGTYGTALSAGCPLLMGIDIDSGCIPNDNEFNGTMDEFRIYNRALTQTEVQALANGDETLDYFVITHDNAGVAGTAENVTITAINDQGATMESYTGTITIDTDGDENAISWSLVTGQGAFADGGGAADSATYTFHANDNGVVVLSVTDTVTETIEIEVSGDSRIDDDTEGTMTFSPAALDHFVIAHDTAATAGVADAVTVTAEDLYGNTKTDYTGTITLDTNGDVDAITWALTAGSGSFTDGGATSDTAIYTFVGGDNGVAGFTITNTKAETIDIDASGDGQSDDDTEGNMVVGPAGINSFIVAHDTAANAGVDETVTVTAYDQYSNVKTDYTGTITLDTNGTTTTITWSLDTGNGLFTEGGASVDTATYTYNSADNGVAVFNINDTTQESIDIDVADGGNVDDDSEGNLVVGTPLLSYFVIRTDNAGNAGIPEAVTITAKDSVGATKTDYTGTITVDTDGTATTIAWSLNTGAGTFNDGGASVDTATYTFDASDNGEVILNITDNTVESLDLDASGDGKVDDGTEGSLVIGNPLLSYFVVSHDASAQASTPEQITITVKDSIGATKTDYTGTITVDTDGTADSITWALTVGNGTFIDGGASVDTATYTYNATDNGVVILTITDSIAETIDIDVSGDGAFDDDTEPNLVIGAGAVDHFLIEHDNSALINIAESVTITAKDASDNTVTGYTGSITMDTDGTATTITWALQSGSGTFVDGGASVDTATYTFDGADNGAATFTITNSSNESVDIDVNDGGTTDDDTEGNMEFATASDIFVDNEDGSPTYTDGGPGWSTRTGGTEYGTNWRRDSTHNDGGWARWTPNITVAGNYNVSCMGRSPEAFLSLDSPFTVFFDGGSSTTDVDQQNGGNPNFDLLGAFRFLTGTSGYVELTDTTDGTLDFSADVCKWEVKGIANAAANAVSTSDVAIGSTNNVIHDFTVTNQHTATDTVTSITVNRLGTASDTDITFVKLFYDSNNSGDFTAGVDTEIGSGTFASGTRTFSG